MNKVYVTKDKFLFNKKVKVKNPIYIEKYEDAKPILLLKDYTYVLLNPILDERVFNTPFPMIQWVKECNVKDDRVVFLDNFTREQLYNSLIKKIPSKDANLLLDYCKSNLEIDNEVYKYKNSTQYHYEPTYKDEKEFCKWILSNKEIKEIPKYNPLYLTSIIFYLTNNQEVKKECLEIEHLIKTNILTEYQVEYLIIKIRERMCK